MQYLSIAIAVDATPVLDKLYLLACYYLKVKKEAKPRLILIVGIQLNRSAVTVHLMSTNRILMRVYQNFSYVPSTRLLAV
jgi:hypothetical protein